MKSPRPEDLESSLTVMCNYTYKLIDRLEAAEKIIEQGHVLLFDKQEPEKSGVLMLSKMIKEYGDLNE